LIDFILGRLQAVFGLFFYRAGGHSRARRAWWSAARLCPKFVLLLGTAAAEKFLENLFSF